MKMISSYAKLIQICIPLLKYKVGRNGIVLEILIVSVLFSIHFSPLSHLSSVSRLP